MPAERSDTVPRHPKEITPQWLTTHLREDGSLRSGSVSAITTRLNDRWNRTQSAHLTLDYDAKAPPEAPRHLFVKLADPHGDSDGAARDEVAFYQTCSQESTAEPLPLVRCYAAMRDEKTGFTCLLLDDLSTTHSQTVWPLPPAIPRCQAAVAALAQLHAHWWTRADKESDATISLLHHQFDLFFEQLHRHLPAFLDFLGDRLPPERRELMAAVCARLPDLLRTRLSGGGHFTLMHGDAHFWNVMFPNHEERHQTVFIDWDDWGYGPGAFDLAYMIALHWYRDRRARYEESLLHCYHDALLRLIPEAYGFDDLMADYRLGHLLNFAVPVYQQQIGLIPAIWWPHLERLFPAYEDLDCAALL